MAVLRFAISLICVTALAGLSVAADPPAPPRYKFEPGQVMTYRTVLKMKNDKDKILFDWTVWVVRSNKDGSFRLVITKEGGPDKGKEGEEHKRSLLSLFYADMFPDGRILNNGFTNQNELEILFPRLPKDTTEATSGWSWVNGEDKVSATPVKADERFVFKATTVSPSDAVHPVSKSTDFTVDLDLGRVESSSFTLIQKIGKFENSFMWISKVLKANATDPAEFKKLVAEERSYFESVEAYQKMAREAAAVAPDVVKLKKQLKTAIAELKTATGELTHPALKADVEARLREATQNITRLVEDAEHRAKLVGKPAEAFVTTDIDGKEVKLADLKGNVVVLDFWYRGCGYCVKAMPQMNGLADDFAGKKVAIFGMNTDEDEADARFVIEKMGLKYPTLKAKGLPEKFGVRGFPTLIVIDQEGNVHDIHAGYSPTLREDVGAKIKALLEQKK